LLYSFNDIQAWVKTKHFWPSNQTGNVLIGTSFYLPTGFSHNKDSDPGEWPVYMSTDNPDNVTNGLSDEVIGLVYIDRHTRYKYGWTEKVPYKIDYGRT